MNNRYAAAFLSLALAAVLTLPSCVNSLPEATDTASAQTSSTPTPDNGAVTAPPELTLTQHLSPTVVMVAGTCERGAEITFSGTKIPEKTIRSDGENYVFSVDVGQRGSDTLSVTARAEGKQASAPLSVRVEYNGDAEDRGVFVTDASRICQSAILPDYYHTNLFSEDECAYIRTIATNRLRNLRRSSGADAKLIYVLVPNPMTVLGDEMSAEMKAQVATDDSRLKQITRTLGSVDGITVLNLTDTLSSHLNDGKLFYNLDTHWTELGAYYGYEALMRVIAEDFPAAAPHPLSDYEVRDVVQTYTDMMYYAGVRDMGMVETAPFLMAKYTPRTPYDAAKGEVADIWDFTNSFFTDKISVTEIEDDTLPSAIFLFDSFGINAISLIAEHFSRLTCMPIWTYRVSTEDMRNQKPDYVIEFISERTLDKLMVND